MSIATSLQTLGTLFGTQRSFWRAVLTTGKELTENKPIFDLRCGGLRPLDWTLDLGSTGDWKKIKELWLLCPNGEQVCLKITEPGTAFQFKTRSLDAIGAMGSTLEAQVIGRVDNKEEGDCTCYIWDNRERRIVTQIRDGIEYREYKANIYNFGTWKSSIAPIHSLEQSVLGLRLS